MRVGDPKHSYGVAAAREQADITDLTPLHDGIENIRSSSVTCRNRGILHCSPLVGEATRAGKQTCARYLYFHRHFGQRSHLSGFAKEFPSETTRSQHHNSRTILSRVLLFTVNATSTAHRCHSKRRSRRRATAAIAAATVHAPSTANTSARFHWPPTSATWSESGSSEKRNPCAIHFSGNS